MTSKNPALSTFWRILFWFSSAILFFQPLGLTGWDWVEKCIHWCSCNVLTCPFLYQLSGKKRTLQGILRCDAYTLSVKHCRNVPLFIKGYKLIIPYFFLSNNSLRIVQRWKPRTQSERTALSIVIAIRKLEKRTRVATIPCGCRGGWHVIYSETDNRKGLLLRDCGDEIWLSGIGEDNTFTISHM